ncbi:MAG: hypothetical protein Q9217_005774 [Psora testacea]
MLKLQEVSANRQTPPLSLPLAKHVNGRKASRINLRTASFEATQHIEYLERELALANAKNDSDPCSAAKMRGLAVENNNLRQELAEWHMKYDARVDDEVQKRLEFEADMKERLDILASESEMKDARIGELEWELECMKIKVRDAEGLEEVNKDLEKRIDVLTNLLVQSPTRMDARSAATSPNKPEPTKRTPRPKSMLSKGPSSPGGVRLSLATVSETAFWQAQGFASLSGKFEAADEDDHLFACPEPLLSPTGEVSLQSPNLMEQSTRTGFLAGRSRSSTYMRSLPSSTSRPTSLMSTSSLGGAPWGVPVVPESDTEANATQKKRRMRRFASGSKSLKPLVLPTASTIPSVPVSATIYPSIESTTDRDSSDISLDPTTTYLSRLATSSPISSPTQPLRCPSMARLQDQTLQALEGKCKDRDTSQSGYNISGSSTDGPRHALERAEATFNSDTGPRSRPRSLQKELEEAEVAQSGLGISAGTYDEPCGDGLIPVTRDATPESGQIFIGLEAPSSKCSSQSAYNHRRVQPQHPDVTPKPFSNLVPSTAIATIPTKSTPSLALTAQHAHGIFTRLTNLICQAKQDPFNLAQRLLSNAWSLNSSRLLGGAGWWLLGLVYHRRKRKQGNCADAVAVGENSVQRPQERRHLLQQGDEEEAGAVGFNWQHFTGEAGRPGSEEHHHRNYGGTWLSPPHVNDNGSGLPAFVPSLEAHRNPRLFPCNDCVEPSSRRTLRLWLHFSLTIVLAIGMALKHGPAALLVEPVASQSPNNGRTEGEFATEHQQRDGYTCANTSHGLRDISEQPSKTDSSIADSGYGSIIFAETLGPVDFEKGPGRFPPLYKSV